MPPDPLLKLRRPDVEPPTGWLYTVEQTGFTIRAGDKASLVERVSKHMSANDLRVPANLPDVVEDWICRRCPPDMIVNPANVKLDPTLRPVTESAVFAATQGYINAWRTLGRSVVTTAAAIERANVCLECSKNSSAASCANCTGIRQWAHGWIRTSLPMEKLLFVCSVTMSLNQIVVMLPAAAVRKGTHPETVPYHPEHCWKKLILNERVDS